MEWRGSDRYLAYINRESGEWERESWNGEIFMSPPSVSCRNDGCGQLSRQPLP